LSLLDLPDSLKTSAYKVAVLDVVDLPLSRYVASTGKPMFISTGMTSEDDIDGAVTCWAFSSPIVRIVVQSHIAQDALTQLTECPWKEL